MANIKGFSISFAPSPSPDVVKNKLFVEPVPNPVTYASPSFDVPNTPVDGFIKVDLKTLMPDVDGVFNIGICAVDDAGNESDMKTAADVPLDFVAPTATGEIEILLQ